MKNLKNLINNALNNKYVQSQNYFYTKEINDIINMNKSKYTIRFSENIINDDHKEFLKRFY